METKTASNEKEFIENITEVHLLNSYLETDEKKMILSISVSAQNDLHPSVTFKILEKEKIWIKSFDYGQFLIYKKNLGFEGTWKAFFKTLDLAINKTGGGDFSIKYPQSLKDNMILTLFHPLNQDLKVKSNICFDKFYPYNTEEYKNYNFEIAVELFKSKEVIKEKEREKLLELTKKYHKDEFPFKRADDLPNKNNYKIHNGYLKKLEQQKNLKRKYNADLVNPNFKKRKGKGATFASEDNDNPEPEEDVDMDDN
jgi:hypothetical protein